MKDINLEDLKAPMPCKWRVQSMRGRAVCIAYVDARQVQKRLDDVCGAENWQSRHKEEKGNLFCEIGIKIDGNWVWKSDVGSESKIEKEKGESSDGFKRAAVMWGVGRFLYNLDPVILPVKMHTNNKDYPYNKHEEKILFSGEELTAYINKSIITNEEIDSEPEASIGQLSMIDSLLKTAGITEDNKDTIEREMHDYDQTRASMCISFLEENQINPLHRGSMSAKETNKAVMDKLNDPKA